MENGPRRSKLNHPRQFPLFLKPITLPPSTVIAQTKPDDHPTWEEAMNGPYAAAMNGPYAAGFWKACEAEINSLNEKDVWDDQEEKDAILR